MPCGTSAPTRQRRAIQTPISHRRTRHRTPQRPHRLTPLRPTRPSRRQRRTSPGRRGTQPHPPAPRHGRRINRHPAELPHSPHRATRCTPTPIRNSHYVRGIKPATPNLRARHLGARGLTDLPLLVAELQIEAARRAGLRRVGHEAGDVGLGMVAVDHHLVDAGDHRVLLGRSHPGVGFGPGLFVVAT